MKSLSIVTAHCKSEAKKINLVQNNTETSIPIEGPQIDISDGPEGIKEVSNAILARIDPIPYDQIIEDANKILKEWADLNKIPINQLPKVEWDIEAIGSSINTSAAYLPTLNKILLNKWMFRDIKDVNFVLRKFISHEAVHAYNAILRTRLRNQFPDLYEKAIKDHFIEVVENGEFSPTFGIDKKDCELHLMDVPELSRSTKDFIINLINKMDLVDFDLTPNFFGSIDDYKHLIKIDSFTEQFKTSGNDAIDIASKKLEQYTTSILFRAAMAMGLSSIPTDSQSSEIKAPLTEEEKEAAIKSLKGYPSTFEGNYLIQLMMTKWCTEDVSLANINSCIAAYSLMADEEREAQRESSRFTLALTKKELELSDLINSERKKLEEDKKSLEADIRITELGKEYIDVLKKLNQLPKKLEALQEKNRLQFELEKCLEELKFIKEQVEKGYGSESNLYRIYLDDLYPLDPTKNKEESEAIKLYRVLLDLQSKQSDLEAKLNEICPIEKLAISSEESKSLINQKDNILLEIKGLTPFATQTHPQFLYNDGGDWVHLNALINRYGLMR